MSEPSSTEDPSEDDDIPWERTLCVAMLAFAAALLVGAVALFIVSRGIPTRQHVSGSYEHLLRPHGVGGSAPVRQVKRRQLVAAGGTGALGGQPRLPSAFPVAAARSLESVDASLMSDDLDPDGSSVGGNSFDKNRYRCGAVFYKYCAVPSREFYFSRALNACIPVGASPGVQLCNRGANRYTSTEDCTFDCVRTPHQGRRCFKTAIFTTCTRDDIVNGSSSWFFNGTGCHKWHFLSGQCPSLDGDAFSSLGQCRARCLGRGTLNTNRVGFESGDNTLIANSAPCRVPRPSVCTSQQLRYPAFFKRTTGTADSLECLSATLVADTEHRCLAGANKFGTHGECESACVQDVGPQGQRHLSE